MLCIYSAVDLQKRRNKRHQFLEGVVTDSSFIYLLVRANK